MDDTGYELAVEKIRKENPGAEIWFGRHPRTGDRWIYRAATKHDTRIYRKIQHAERERGADGDQDVAHLMLMEACLYYPFLKADDPAADTIAKLVARRPMILSVIAGEICEVSGFTLEAEQKKL